MGALLDLVRHPVTTWRDDTADLPPLFRVALVAACVTSTVLGAALGVAVAVVAILVAPGAGA